MPGAVRQQGLKLKLIEQLRHSGDIPVFDVDHVVFQSTDTVNEIVQTYLRWNQRWNHSETVIALEQMALGDQKQDRDRVAVLRVRSLDQ
jgi:hypothetical protein